MKTLFFIFCAVSTFALPPTRFSKHRNLPGAALPLKDNDATLPITPGGRTTSSIAGEKTIFFKTNPFSYPNPPLGEKECQPFTWEKWLSALKISQVFALPGKTIYFLASERKKNGLYQLDTQTEGPEQTKLVLSPTQGIHSFAVSDSKKVIAFLSPTEKGTFQLYAYLPSEAKTMLLEEEAVAESFTFLANSEEVLYVKVNSEKQERELWKVSLPQVKKEKLAAFSLPISISDTFSPWVALTASHSDDSTSLLFFNYLTKIKVEKKESEVNLSQAKFLTANKFVFLSNKPAEFTQLYESDLSASITRARQITAAHSEFKELFISPNRKKLALVGSKDHFHHGEIFTYNQSSKLISKRTFLKHNETLLTSLSLTNQEVLFVSSHLFQMPQIYLWEEDRTQIVLKARSVFTPCKPLVFEKESILSFDKQAIPAWYFGNPEIGEKKIIVRFDSSFHSQQHPFFNEWLIYAAQQGYGFVTPNLRGSTGFGKTYEKLGGRDKRLDILKDANATIDFAKSKKNGNRLSVVGGYWGGLLALRTQAESKKPSFKSIVFRPMAARGNTFENDLKLLSPQEKPIATEKVFWLSPPEEQLTPPAPNHTHWFSWALIDEEQKVELYKKMLLFLDRN